MITKETLQAVLSELGYTGNKNKMKKHFSDSNCDVVVDIKNEKIIYPKAIKYERATTLNFSENENFVVLECVTRLLEQGYKPEHIYLEAPIPGGRSDRNAGYSDILVSDNDGIPYMIIECKTTNQEKNDEFDSAWRKTKKSGGQLFNYFNTYRQAKYLVLYASDYTTEICQLYYLISLIDNEKYLDANPSLKSYQEVSDDNGSHTEYFEVWKNTYQYDVSTNGVFEKSVAPFHVGKKKISSEDLKDIDANSMQKKYHQYAAILRQYNVSSKENAFDKLINLFLAKIVDETYYCDELKCNWKGAAYDNYFDLHDRLLELYKIGMREFFNDEVTYIENQKIEDAFGFLVSKADVAKDIIYEYFRELKYFNNNPFAILDVHNRELFYQNAVILKEVVMMLQDIKLKSEKQNQFLGDLFEGFLDQGVKQSEGQFFTPMPIVRFIVSSLPLEKIITESEEIPHAIDYACGAGHFLTEYARQIKPFVDAAQKSEISEYYKAIIGIEKEYRLSKVSQVSAYMYGLDGIKIRYNDALSHDINGVLDHSFSVLVANPPYSVNGFLETLGEDEQKQYAMLDQVPDTANNNAIEVFFVERAKQLLKSGGIAAIILPSTILTNDGIYASCRELIIKYFDVIGITFLEGKTFGKTVTTTVTLFLERKKIEPDSSVHFANRINEWFEGNFIDDEVYEDQDILEAYCQNVGVDLEDYKTLMHRTPSAELIDSQLLQSYWEYFNPAEKGKAVKGINSNAKKIKSRMTDRYKKAAFRLLSAEQQEAEIFEQFIQFVVEIEKEKLYYYALVKKNSRDVVVVKSPSSSKEQKDFLGYEWSSSRGHEGIHYLNVTTEDSDEDTINQIRGIEEIVTPLFDPNNLQGANTINTCIRKNYLGEEVIIPKNLEEYVSIISLEDMIDFSEISFTKQINLSAKKKFEVTSKYEQEPLSKIVTPLGGQWVGKKGPFVRAKVLRSTNFTMQGGMILDDVAEIDVEQNAFLVRQLRKGDIVIEKSGGSATQAVGRVLYFDKDETDYSFANFTARLRVFNDKYIPKYIHCYLNFAYQSGAMFDYQSGMAGIKNLKMNKYLAIGVPCPSKKIQKAIINDCEALDNLFASTRMSNDEYAQKIIKIFKDKKVATIIG